MRHEHARMLTIDLQGKRAFVAGVADDGGFGFAIAKHLAMAGASVTLGTWPPAYGIFTKLIQLGKIKDSLAFPSGGNMQIERVYPFDGDFDTLADIPLETRENRRYKEHADVSIQGVVDALRRDF